MDRNLLKTGIVMFLILCVFTACSQEEIYQHALEYADSSRAALQEASNAEGRILDGNLENAEQEMEKLAGSGTKFLSDTSKAAGIYVIAGSVIIGIILAFLSAKASAIKLYKMAWFVFIIGIPCVTIILIYGLAFLASWFM